jgi:hypothetical protein
MPVASPKGWTLSAVNKFRCPQWRRGRNARPPRGLTTGMSWRFNERAASLARLLFVL